MKKSHSVRRLGFVPVLAMSFCTGLAARAARADDKVDNPRYLAWAKFQPGSTATVFDPEMTVDGHTMRLQVAVTLVSVTADEAKVSVAMTMIKNGKPDGDPSKMEKSIPAKTDKANVVDQGTEDVKEMDKTFKCHVWKLSDDTDGDPHPDDFPTVFYLNDEVPGGIVKEKNEGDKSAFELKAMEAKK